MTASLLDRTTQPPFCRIEEIALPNLVHWQLRNQIPCYLVNTGTQEAVRLEFIFKCGRATEAKNDVAQFVAKCLLGGTHKHTASQLAEAFSELGAFTEVTSTSERFVLSVYALASAVPVLLPLIMEVLTSANFPADEVAMQQAIAKQQLQINLEKNNFLSAQYLRENLFGPTHPLGKVTTEENIDSITPEDLQLYYNQFICKKPFQLMLAGNFPDAVINSVNEAIGSLPIVDDLPLIRLPEADYKGTSVFEERPNSVQSSISLGRRLFVRLDPDYFPFLLLNTILGGYFGSRLMKNIREEKGFTYGISSSIVPLRTLGYFVIATDVKKEFTLQTLAEIRKEIELLQTEKVSLEELETVKNYIAGNLAGSTVTPFDIADKYKIILGEQLPFTFYNNFIQHLREVTPEQVQEMAIKYLQPADLIEVVVGGKE